MNQNQFAGMRRLPLAPLLAAAGATSANDLARRAGRHPRQMRRYADAGVPESSADRLAVACGLHPGEVWPEWFEEAS